MSASKNPFFEIAPFRALRFDVARAATPIANLVCPPYDVIDFNEQEALGRLSAYNTVNLILPELSARRVTPEGEYTYGPQKQMFAKWREQQVLQADAKPSVYVYHQSFPHPLQPELKMTRRGILALTRLSDFSEGKMKPHEFTLAGPKADRLNLMKSVFANMSPIFGLYSDAQKRADTWASEGCQDPAFHFTTADGIEHTLWVVSDAACVEKVCRQLAGTLFIADGHHRYETALNFRKFLQGEAERAGRTIPEMSQCHYIPIFLANLEDDGLLILPTHRLVHGVSDFSPESLLEKLKEEFVVEKMPEEAWNGFGVENHLQGDKAAFLFQFKTSGGLNTFKLRLKQLTLGADVAQHPLDVLDLTILHRDILEKHLGIDKKALEEHRHLHYTRDVNEALSQLRSGKIQAAFYTRSPLKKHVVKVCEAGLRMPQKSTYFFPKVLSGLVFRSIDPYVDVLA